MDIPFKNPSQLGSFGEFVYREFCESRSYITERTNSFHTDFRLTPINGDEHFYVDVKSCIGKRGQYGRGGRRHGNIVYDRISIVDDSVYLIPDEKSPFNGQGHFINIGDLATIVRRWRSGSMTSNKRKKITTDEARDDIKCASVRTYPRLRFVERGNASLNGWDGTVDNLPGSQTLINQRDATVFLQYGFELENGDFKQPLIQIILFPHDLIDQERILRDANDRQKAKGIKRVVDLDKFRSAHPELVFRSIEDLKAYLRK